MSFSFWFLVGCSENHEELVRIDYQFVLKDGTYGDKIVIMKKGELKNIQTPLKAVKWEKNTKPSMARMEDVRARFFYKDDKKEAERDNRTGESDLFTDYMFWLNRESNTVTILSSNKNESFGTLENVQASNLMDAFTLKWYSPK